ncbi:DNA cytosine methyltransferase [Burkholderia plantarii]|uniref:DNA cytosine methyltransferase n=1 Tax=Burkholderia plantarii TaxID=41899 RepID=UPI0018DBEC4D|nr:DNA cytosine methyltransferase [Burkholderia plantarii]MBI0327663.1 DNA cytosine methyltransferase [Burkholderia plantarii]
MPDTLLIDKARSPSDVVAAMAAPTKADQDERPQIISLFCGAGGMDIGFEQAGFRIIFAADYDLAAVETHNFNFRQNSAIQLDLSAVSPKEFITRLRSVCPDAAPIGIVGGPPCQGFSRANVNRSSNDPRNQLANRYADIVNALCREFPIQFFLFENVPEITAEKNKGFLASLKRRLAKQFLLNCETLNAADFGVPQTRVRFFMAGLRRHIATGKFTFPVAGETHRTVHATISNLPEPVYFQRNLSADDIPNHPNHWTMRPKSARFQVPQVRAGSRSFIQLDWHRPSRTVAYGHREIHVHPRGHRRLSIYEAMLLQSFPPSYQILGNLSEQVTQISNAVPPPVSRGLAIALKAQLNLGEQDGDQLTAQKMKAQKDDCGS